ncbi:MAG: phage terminase large subunit family protein [Synergistaceae bacterium]|nr:phage terminase large subunit family protein [Synergistaceae bacterium]
MKQINLNDGSLWLPPPELTISEWADKFRRISPEASAEPGEWITSKAEYQRAIMDAVCDPLVERVVMMTSAQIGKTEILLNTIGYYIDQDPSPILVLNPTIDMSEAFSKDRLAPMIRDTPCLSEKIQDSRKRGSENTIRHKKFYGGHITLAGTNSPASLASRPIRILLCDEIDRYPVSAKDEGDPLSLAMKRTQNFWNRRILLVSTPVLTTTSRILKDFNISSQEEWCVPCPECGEYQPFEWERIIYREVSEPVMKCKKCGRFFNEFLWKSEQKNGKWIAANEEIKNIRGFHLNSFASPWATWHDLVKQYEEARINGEESMKTFVNTVLGLPYENNENEIEIDVLDSHREKYKAELPDGVLVLTCGVDTQDDRLECEVVGWGKGKESWGIEYRIFYGDPGQEEVWNNLDDFLRKMWKYNDGAELGISCTFIDCGGHFTDEVYKFCKPRTRRNIFPIVGRGREGMPSVGKPSYNNRRHVPLFALGVNTIKGVLYSRLRVDRVGAGYCHFPIGRGYDKDYFKGLLSEKMVIKRIRGRDTVTWEVVKTGIRNEPLDTRVYATGALELYNPNFERCERRRKGIKTPTNNVSAKKIKRVPTGFFGGGVRL